MSQTDQETTGLPADKRTSKKPALERFLREMAASRASEDSVEANLDNPMFDRCFNKFDRCFNKFDRDPGFDRN